MDFFKKIPILKKKLRGCFNQAPQQQYFCTDNSLSLMQKLLGYAINKFVEILQSSRKNRDFQENLKLQNFSHELKQELFCQTLF